jgi:hypothetical protein
MTTAEISGLLSVAMRDLVAGDLPPNVGNALASLAKVMLVVGEASASEERNSGLNDLLTRIERF